MDFATALRKAQEKYAAPAPAKQPVKPVAKVIQPVVHVQAEVRRQLGWGLV